jgi:hypothetical protein
MNVKLSNAQEAESSTHCWVAVQTQGCRKYFRYHFVNLCLAILANILVEAFQALHLALFAGSSFSKKLEISLNSLLRHINFTARYY